MGVPEDAIQDDIQPRTLYYFHNLVNILIYVSTGQTVSLE